MLNQLILTFCFLIILNTSSKIFKPIIAIVTNPYPENSDESTQSTLYLTYTLYAESLGFNVLPLLYDYSVSDIDKFIQISNGLIFQGGMRDLHKGKYESQSKIIIEIANKYKVPIFFICQGFELLHYLITDEKSVLENYNAFGVSLPSKIEHKTIINSKMFTYFIDRDLDWFEKNNSTIHFHNLGVNPNAYINFPSLNDTLLVTSYGFDLDNKIFVNSVESKDFDKNKYFAVQFHPEKSSFTKNEIEYQLNNIYTLLISDLIGISFAEQVREHYNNTNFKRESLFLNEEIKLLISNEVQLTKDGYFYMFDSELKEDKLINNFIKNRNSNSLLFYFFIGILLISIGIFIGLYTVRKIRRFQLVEIRDKE